MGFVPFTFIDLIDILFVAYIMYWIYRTTKGTNAPYIISGIIVVYLLWVIVKTLNMELLSTILGHIISVGAIALIVVFQPEIRRFLQKIGMSQKRFNFISRIFNHGSKIAETNLQPLVVAAAKCPIRRPAHWSSSGSRAICRSSPRAASASTPRFRRS